MNCLLPQALFSHWRGDPLRIRQVLTNLIDNAVKFTERGEVSVNVSQSSIADSQNELRFEVQDTGIGISPAAQLKLFESFSQGDSAISRSLGGSGLGLFISKKLVDLMGGTIGVDSVQGVGSCFWFTLPLVQSEGMETTESFYDLAGKRTLIVDDNATNRKILSTYLSSWGLEVSAFDNGSTALMQLQTSALQGLTCDLIVLDMQMPNMDGLTLAKYLAEIPALAKIPIILLSSGDLLELSDYESTGIVQRLLKPARQMQLFDAVVNALQGGAKVTQKPAPPQLERPSYKGKKVLVVEDNKINQKVIVAKLAKFDIVPDLAENGQLALDKLAQSVYDLILMDCQMPVMDGFIATRGLRLLEASQGLPHQTVIALTANAMKGDREKCLAAGMDDYLTKPIVTEQLMDMLARRLGVQPAEIIPDLGIEDSTPVIVWDATAALDNLDGDSALLDEMIALFLIEVPKLVIELTRVQAEGNLPALANVAHTIKGTVAQFFAEPAKACALLLEQAARSGQPADYQGMTDALVKAVTELINNLRLAKSPK
jgi:CheY-like chemotaxis protein